MIKTSPLGGASDDVTAVTGGIDALDLHAAANELLTRVMAEAADAAKGLEVTTQAIEGRASASLINAVTEDDLLVVGSRGHGGFAGLLLGSVSQQCAHHSPCPVVILPAALSAAELDLAPAAPRKVEVAF